MTRLDKYLQQVRIRKAMAWIPEQSRVLDIGCLDAALFEALGNRLKQGVGIDPLVQTTTRLPRYTLLPGRFPGELDPNEPFDVITLLAVIEHIPQAELSSFIHACYTFLRPGGRLIMTVPDPRVDIILDILRKFRLIDGLSLEEHYGFELEKAMPEFTRAGFIPEHCSTFQLGLNNLLVWTRPV